MQIVMFALTIAVYFGLFIECMSWQRLQDSKTCRFLCSEQCFLEVLLLMSCNYVCSVP